MSTITLTRANNPEHVATVRARFRELRLDTLPSMASAQALYRRLGFVEIAPYNDAHLPGTLFYALELG